MEIRHRLLEFNNTPKYDLLKRELEKLRVAYQINELGSLPSRTFRSIEFSISEDDPLYPRIERLIQEHDFYAQTGVYFSQKDVDEAEWLYAISGEFQYPQPEDNYLEATYDITNYCRYCGMGAVQDKPFRLKSDFKQKRSQFLGLHWVFDEIFARPEAKAILESENITGVTFTHPLHHRKKEEIENVFQMHIETIAIPGLVTEGLNTVTCQEDNEESWLQKKYGKPPQLTEHHSFCGRVKYHYPRRDCIKFTRDTFLNVPDIVKSFEYFGSGADAHRLVLVSGRFMKIVAKHKLRGLKFEPIMVL